VFRFVVVLFLAAALTASAAEPAAARPCENTYGGDVIAAYGVGCSKARDVVRTWAVRYRRDGVINRWVFRFRCRGRNDPYEGLTIRCRRPSDNARVRWYANVPA
jgi:hypothetical protein